MRGVVMHTAGDVRVEEREDPKIIEPTDAIIRLTATCICVAVPRYRAGRPPGHGTRVRRHRRGGRLRGQERQGRRLRRRLVRHLRRDRKIDPGKVFDVSLPLDRAAEGYKAMDERRAIKVLLQP